MIKNGMEIITDTFKALGELWLLLFIGILILSPFILAANFLIH